MLARNSHTSLKLLLVAVVVLLMAASVGAEIGFKASFADLPRVVSDYREPVFQFSAAMHPRSRFYLRRLLEYRPRVDSSSFPDSSMTFRTALPYEQELIPLSVDAMTYNRYLRERNRRDKFWYQVTTQIINPPQQRGRSGINIGVALPKRFERMFGEGGGNLKISGYRRITFSGRSSWTDAPNTPEFRQSKFPSLNMEQVSRFDITGTIGSKITVSVSQDSQTDIPLANRLMIRYKGDEDDILKTIEAGNTTLSLPNTRFVGYSSRINGLFGIKTAAQVGSLTLTAIASQEKGSAETASITASGAENARDVRDYAYAEGRIFDLAEPGFFSPKDIVDVLYIYEHDERDSASSENAVLLVDPNQPTAFSTLRRPVKVKRLEGEGSVYEVVNDPLRNLHYVYFNSRRRYAFGVYMEIQHDDGTRDTIGNLSDGSDSLKLKMIQDVPSYYSQNHPTWDLMWRNVYSIQSGLDIDDIDVTVWKGLPGTENSSASRDEQLNESGQSQGFYVTILGLDQYDRSGPKRPDNLLDDRLEVYRSDWGLLIFPNRKPFASDTTFTDELGRETTPLNAVDRVPKIYDYDSETERAEASKFFIRMATRSVSSIIRLNRANIIEGSERVTAGGVQLVRDVDYSIDYDLGQITLLSDAAVDPNAEIRVDFEWAPFLALQKKTLVGLRAEYDWSDDFQIGSTLLYKSDKAEDRKPRVGQETAKALVADVDVSFNLHPNFLTKAVDALPLVTTEAPSNIRVAAEVAQSRPNPNVEGVAYVDDFESALDQLDLGRSRVIWSLASKPLQADPNAERTKMLWHNPEGIVDINDIYPDIDAVQGQGGVALLRLINRPDPSGMPTWAGIQRFYNSRVDAKRAQLFEIRVRGNHGIMHFDFGQISEDVNGDGALQSEDTDDNGSVIDAEDTGLDLKFDNEEDGYDVDTLPDPSDDDWWIYQPDEGLDGSPPPVPKSRLNNSAFQDSVRDSRQLVYYEWLNGTEGNNNDPLVIGVPDEEVLSSQGFFTENAYFSFSIDLSDDRFLVEGSEYDPHNTGVPWRTYRIPIRDTTAIDTVIEPADASLLANWSTISHTRIWFEDSLGVTQHDTVEVAGWYFVQSNWQDSLIVAPENLATSQTNFYVASVGTEDNTFRPPPGVEPYYDKTNNVEEAQRGLSLVYADLVAGDSCLVTKDLITTENYAGYRSLEMYVHGDERSSSSFDSLLFFFRVGTDATNYYEYFTTLDPGWVDGNNVNIDFNEITALKDAAQRGLGTPGRGAVDTAAGNYRVFGNPNINQVRFFAAGLLNLDSNETITGEVWLDELRVTGVRKDVGTAGRVSIGGNLADLFTYNFNYETRDPYFRGISAATRGGSVNNLGSGRTQRNVSYGGTININKLLPRSWNARLPLSFNYSKATQIPLLRNSSDVVLPDEIRDQEKSVSENRSFRVSESFSKKSKNPLFSILLNRQSVSFSYSRANQQSVNRPFALTENYNVNGSYDMGIRDYPKLPIFFWTGPIPLLKKLSTAQLGLYPRDWKWSGSLNRNLSINEDQNRNRITSLKRDFSGSMNLNYLIFENMSATYSYATNRDLSNPDLVRLSLKDPKLGVELNFRENVSLTYDPKLLSFLTAAGTYSASYSDAYDRNTESRRSDMSRSWSVRGTLDHLRLLGRSSRATTRVGPRRPRAPIARKGDDTTKTDNNMRPEPPGTPFYEYIVDGLRFATGWIQPVRYQYGQNYSNFQPGMIGRPSLRYQFGLEREVDTTEVGLVPTSQTRRANEGQNYELSSGFTLLGGIVTDVRFKRSIGRSVVTTGKRTENVSTNWPDLNIRIQRFNTLPLLKPIVNKFIEIFAPRTGYRRQVSEVSNIDDDFRVSRQENVQHNPLIQLNFKLFRSLSLSSSYTLQKNRIEKYNPTTGRLSNETRNRKTSLTFTSRYAFSAPGGIQIPLFGNVKFSSTVTLDLGIRMNTSYAESKALERDWVVTEDKSDFAVSPVISYTFSQQIRGGLTARWQDSNDEKSQRRSHVRELQMWAEIRF